ncbi:hypothetical protein TVAG_478430 [Trichomonas vaginalis G3]|uniref:Uncharacterized protein n=1 Tax=Trichomonas vaginalis (strain ATCC PRA-98 / G3) TaxID=412133 RepID=A2DZV9_TRIV3|nr:protein kinase-like (PK-like) family [Trichomonas vaginalis G3]EAY14018.1 hypothetical protein TVAG_478430 [Trichomonas vaginalis G3]KAI5519547.1 protein kinase-like (PK-like) family [Trichomonas vaginalis G3]|eukprot:XP_001326241.1 hypothetical protein [Trichomonas vaginalis G3]
MKISLYDDFSIISEIYFTRFIGCLWTLVASDGQFLISYVLQDENRQVSKVTNEKMLFEQIYPLLPNVFAELKDIEIDQSVSVNYHYYPCGDLESFIKSGDVAALTTVQRLKIAYGIALSIKIMNDNGLYFKYLASSSVFLDENFEPHITNYAFPVSEVHKSIQDNIFELGSIFESLSADSNDFLYHLSIQCKKSNISIEQILEKIISFSRTLDVSDEEIFIQYMQFAESNIAGSEHGNLESTIQAMKVGSTHAKDLIEYMVDMEFIEECKKI